MITVKLSGGLGNQMFQYAAARRLALKHGAQLRLDTSAYGSWLTPPLEAHRPFELMAFALAAPLVPRGAELAAIQAGRLAASALRHAGLPAPRRYVRYLGLPFDPRILELPDGSDLTGYFQSEKFFAGAEEQIRKEFTPRDAQLHERICEHVAELRRPARPLVSLHVRRGDYVDFKRGAMIEPTAKLREAMAMFEGCDFLVFSDDLRWCRENLRGENIFFSPFGASFENLWAMTRCDHNIIAGSTFGWWGAWLNPNPAKKVVARAQWFTAWPHIADINRDIHAKGWETYA